MHQYSVCCMCLWSPLSTLPLLANGVPYLFNIPTKYTVETQSEFQIPSPPFFGAGSTTSRIFQVDAETISRCRDGMGVLAHRKCGFYDVSTPLPLHHGLRLRTNLSLKSGFPSWNVCIMYSIHSHTLALLGNFQEIETSFEGYLCFEILIEIFGNSLVNLQKCFLF